MLIDRFDAFALDVDGNVCIAHYKIRIKDHKISIESNQQDGACPQELIQLKAVTTESAKNYKWLMIFNDEPGASPTPVGNSATIDVSPGFEYQLTVGFFDGCESYASIELKDLSQNPCNIKEYFERKGFFAIPIEITSRPQARQPELRRDPCADPGCTQNICVRDDANLTFKVGGKDVNNLKGVAQTALNSFKGFGYNESFAFISKNDNICDCNNYLEDAEQRFTNAKLGYWLHLFEGAECDGQDYLFVKCTNPTDAAFLTAGLDHFLNYKNSDGPTVIHTVAFDLMLPNFEDAKTPEFFDKTSPKATPPPASEKEAVLCTAGLQEKSVAVIVGSGHLVMLPENSIWRYSINPEVAADIFNGALTGYSKFDNGVLSEIYEARWGKLNNVKTHVGFFKLGAVLPALETLQDLNNISQEFKVPAAIPVETYFGEHLILNNEADGCNEAYNIHKATISPLKPLIPRPFGPLVSSKAAIGTFTDQFDVPNGFYKICPNDLSQIAENINSGEVNVYFNFKMTGGGMLYALNPGGITYKDWVLVRRDDATKEYTYYQWNCVLGVWQIINKPDPRCC